MKTTLCRSLALALACAVFITALLPVTATATESDGAWVELLESATVNDSGNNLLTVSAVSSTFLIKTPQYMRCTKIDLVLTHPSGQSPSALYVRYNGVLYQLTKLAIDSTTTRFYGANIPDTLYADVVFQLDRNSTTQVTYQVVTCKVTALVSGSVKANGFLRRYYSDPNPLTLPNKFEVDGDGSTGTYQYLLVPVIITDWRKFDTVTLYGSGSAMAISSFRASIGNIGLPYEINYMQAIPTGIDSDGGFYYDYISSTETNYYGVDGTPDEFSTEDGFASGETWDTSTVVYGGSVLYTVTIDLSGIDRTLIGDLNCMFTAIASPGLGYAFNVQDASGTVSVADTSGASWWSRITAFFTDLLGSDSTAGDEYAAEMESQSQQMQEAVDQMNEVTRPAVDDVQVTIDEYVTPDDMAAVGDMVGGLMENPLVLSMVMISLVLSLAAYIVYGKR